MFNTEDRKEGCIKGEKKGKRRGKRKVRRKGKKRRAHTEKESEVGKRKGR
jgi:hypothetical protein